MRFLLLIFCMLCMILLSTVAGSFLVPVYSEPSNRVGWKLKRQGGGMVLNMVARYGPTDSSSSSSGLNKEDEIAEWKRLDEERLSKLGKDFRKLVGDVVDAQSKPEHLPRIMTQNMDLLLSMQVGHEGTDIISEIVQDAEAKNEQTVMVAIDFILTFCEEFVDQAQSLDDANKHLLGKIIKCMTKYNRSPEENDNDGLSTLNTQAKKNRLEDELNQLIKKEKPNFTAGFLRHLEGECGRIASAPKMTPQSAKLLETLRVIQTRVLEEIGTDLGEGALVLGQLLGYTNKQERLAVLEAGLMVRGVGFAKELLDLADEALEGFQKVPDADPDLVTIVQDIRDRIFSYIDKNNVMQ